MKQILPALVLVTACGGAPPERDPLHADVVVESAELEGAVSKATSWWYEATTSEVAFNVADACSPDRTCVRIHTGRLSGDEAGLTAYPIGHPESSVTTIAEDLEPELVDITVAHELGHVLGLAHDDHVMTAVMQDADWALPSEWTTEKR